MTPTSKLSFEVRLTQLALAFTVAATAFFLRDVLTAAKGSTYLHWAEVLAFVAVVAFLIYGNVGYQLTRIGHLRRLLTHVPAAPEELASRHAGTARPLLFLVPSYKEEARIVRQTLLSAALQEYPNRRVALLIDDPYRFDDPEALAALVTVRQLATELDSRLKEAAVPFVEGRTAFHLRCLQGPLALTQETCAVGRLYLNAAEWFEREAACFAQNDHTDRFFVDAVLLNPARAHRASGETLLCRGEHPAGALTQSELERHYDRLESLFRVELTSFERKRFANLSHEPNKAMNLNTYISLLGKGYREAQKSDGMHFVEAEPGQETLHIPEATYLITLDADSLLLPEYALRLIRVMEQPGNERIAVAQTPYSAIPDASSVLERTAGATTDVQYLIHQGFTHHHATFWVGANALLRRAALEDIAVIVGENGRPIKRYIQDRTVIEDTESTVDLIDKGWRLYNYPARLAYSATPSDFGALVVQRGRWANGGLIILPKLLRYVFSGPERLRKLREGFFRIHYLTSIAGVNFGLMAVLAYPFPDTLQSPWLPLTALPYYGLYARDLWQSGYRKSADLLRVYALNLLLLPINIGGVLRSLHQAVKGHRIPFHRTPKVAGRTSVPARYIAALFLIVGVCLFAGLQDLLDRNIEHSIFAFVNGALFVYAIGEFIGFAAAWEDLHRGIAESLARVRLARTDSVSAFE